MLALNMSRRQLELAQCSNNLCEVDVVWNFSDHNHAKEPTGPCWIHVLFMSMIPISIWVEVDPVFRIDFGSVGDIERVADCCGGFLERFRRN
jgi:hypothetical protein